MAEPTRQLNIQTLIESPRGLNVFEVFFRALYLFRGGLLARSELAKGFRRIVARYSFACVSRNACPRVLARSSTQFSPGCNVACSHLETLRGYIHQLSGGLVFLEDRRTAGGEVGEMSNYFAAIVVVVTRPLVMDCSWKRLFLFLNVSVPCPSAVSGIRFASCLAEVAGDRHCLN